MMSHSLKLPTKKRQRLKQQLTLKVLKKSPTSLTAGIDEAGRGAWAGPVVAAAVIWPGDVQPFDINDSKQLSPEKRERLFLFIYENAIAVGVGVASVAEIDQVGIGQANKLAMERAVTELKVRPDLVLVDGYRVEFLGFASEGVIRGDSEYICVAAASIVAKVTRDRMMVELDGEASQYAFAVHKGYGTAIHRKALGRSGPSEHHRKSFAPIRALLNEVGA